MRNPTFLKKVNFLPTFPDSWF